MKNTEFKLKKLAENGNNPKAIEVRTDSRIFGIVYVDGAFDPRVGIELYPVFPCAISVKENDFTL